MEHDQDGYRVRVRATRDIARTDRTEYDRGIMMFVPAGTRGRLDLPAIDDTPAVVQWEEAYVGAKGNLARQAARHVRVSAGDYEIVGLETEDGVRVSGPLPSANDAWTTRAPAPGQFVAYEGRSREVAGILITRDRVKVALVGRNAYVDLDDLGRDAGDAIWHVAARIDGDVREVG